MRPPSREYEHHKRRDDLAARSLCVWSVCSGRGRAPRAGVFGGGGVCVCGGGRVGGGVGVCMRPLCAEARAEDGGITRE